MTDKEDVDHTIDAINSGVNGSTSLHYFVAVKSNGEVCGVMGMTGENINAELYDVGELPIELVNAYVKPNLKGSGIGSALANKLELTAIEQGNTKLIIVSGSRNREFGYPFWEKRYGKPARLDKEYWGLGNERVVWTKQLGE